MLKSLAPSTDEILGALSSSQGNPGAKLEEKMAKSQMADTVHKDTIISFEDVLAEMIQETKFAELKDKESLVRIALEDMAAEQTGKLTGPKWYSVNAMIGLANPQRRARYKFTKKLIEEYKDWISNDWKEGNIKVLDYACGEGLASRALSPHVSQIIGIDQDEAAVLIYNEFFKRQSHPKCSMQAFVGNLMPLDDCGKSGEIIADKAILDTIGNFDLAVVSLGMDCYEIPGKSAHDRHQQLINNLNAIIELLSDDGTLLIIDIHKAPSYTGPRVLQLPGGYKGQGYHSQEIIDALEEIGMDEINVIDGIKFQYEATAEDKEL